MTQKDKELLLKDLCARLPYGVKTSYSGHEMTIRGVDVESKTVDVIDWGKARFAAVRIEKIKPYLRPLSSMTDEEEAEIVNIIEEVYDFTFRTEELLEMISMQKTFPMASVDWFYENDFDIRGLIEKGLALEAPNGMYNN